MTDPCPKCVALYEIVRQVAFADPDTLPRKIRDAYRDYRKVAPGCAHLECRQ